MAKVFEVRFEQVAQKATAGRFSVPKSVVEVLGVDASSKLFVEVTSHKGAKSSLCQLKSGAEIYGDFDGHFEPGEAITVRVTKISE